MTFELKVNHKPFHNLLVDIQYWWGEKKEKRQRHKARMAKRISEIKYLEHVVLVEGCIYSVDIYKKKFFKSMEQTLEYCRRIPLEKIQKKTGDSIRISIYNPNAPDEVESKQIPQGLLVKNCKDAMCVFAKERTVSVAADLSKVYTEYYTLNCNDNLFDYGLLYGNYPAYTGKELCISSVKQSRASDETTLFIPELTWALKNPNAVYDCLRDVGMAYHCWYIVSNRDGSVYDDGDGAYPWWTHPVSSFRNIGKAGVYYDCWDKILGGTSYREHNFAVDGYNEEPFSELLRFTLLECKRRELPEGEEYFTITDSYEKADGLMPADAAGLSLRDSREKLWVHAKKRYICVSPSFDAVYWESFELQDEGGQIYRFCFDYALLEADSVKITEGSTYRTSYWSKARLGNPLANAKVRVCSAPDPGETYDGHGNIMFCCQCKLECGSEDMIKIPASTLSTCEGL